jgi:hypothetical protein
MLLTAATQIPILAYIITTLGAVLGLTGALYAIFNPPKLIAFLSRDQGRMLEDTPEDKSDFALWLATHYVLLRAIGVIILLASAGVISSIIEQLVIRK